MNAISRPPTLDSYASADHELPTYDARGMMPDSAQARILLDNQTYYLRITRAGKLILTK